MRIRSAFASASLFAFLLAGCGSGSTVTLSSSVPGTSIVVAVAPTSAVVDAGQTVPLTATVTNDASNKGVTWSVSAGGGTVATSSGLTNTYTAPAVQASSVVVTATSVADPTKTGQLTVVVNAAPAINTSAPLPVGYAGVAYSAQIPAVGGTGALTISLSSGTLPAGLTLSSSGVISGTPATAGTSTFVVQVRDSAPTPVATTAQLTLTIGAMAINPVSLTGAIVGTAYPNTQLSTTGNVGAVTYSIASGALPTGLTLSAAGVISGTPTAAGTSSFTVRAVDTAGQSATLALSIVTASRLTFSNVALPTATANQPIAQYSFQAAGGTSPYSYALASGSTLPAGLSLTSSGLLSGTPTTNGNYSFNVIATDAGSTGSGMVTPARQTATATVTLIVASFTVTSSLPAGAVGTAYSGSITAAGGTAPYTYAVTAGALPAGLTLNATTGAITGTPTAAGTASFTVTATDGAARTASTAGSIAVASQLAFANVTLPAATAGTAITSYQFTPTGGTAPYTFALTSGSTLPAGLSLSTAGVLSGTPTTAGNYTFRVTATDSGSSTGAPQQSATSTVTLVVNSSAAITVAGTLPGGVVGSAYSGTVTASGGTSPYTYAAASGSSLPAGLTLNASTGAITGSPTAAGTFSFSITATDAGNRTGTSSLTVTVASKLVFANVTLPSATVNAAITTYQLQPTGGTQPYAFALAAGSSLPAGLNLSTAGAISGTPTTAGNYTFNVTATDSGSTTAGATAPAQQSATATVSLTVTAGAAVTVTPGTLPNAVPNSPYSQSLAGNGGTAPYTFSVVSGAVPTGLTVETSGVVDGQPTAGVGTYQFVVKATDANGSSGQQTVTINVSNQLSAGPNNPLLNGRYAFLFTGYNNGSSGTNVYGVATVGQLIFDGNNGVTGTLDSNSAATGFNANLGLSGSYRINADNRGTLVFTVTGAAAPTTFQISLQQVAGGTAGQFRLLEFDSQNPNDNAGITGSGVGSLQTGTFGTVAPAGSFVLSEIGETCAGCNTASSDFGSLAQVGVVSVANGAVASSTSQLDTRLTTNTRTLVPGGTFTLPAGTSGRGTIALTDSTGTGAFTGQPLNFVFYAVSPTTFYMVSADAHNNGYGLLSGTATLRTAAAGVLTGNSVAYISGNLPGNGTTTFSRQVAARVQRFVTTGTSVATSGYQNSNGTPAATTTGTGATYTAGSALGTLKFTDTDGTPYNFYMLDNNSGYSLGLGTIRGVVRVEPQTTSTFSSGLYTFGSQRTPTTDYGVLGGANFVPTSTTAGNVTENEYFVFYDGSVGNRLYRVPQFTQAYTNDNTNGFIQVGATNTDFRGFVVSGSRFVTILDQAQANVPVVIFEK